MASLFDDILVQGVRAGKIPARTQDARNWFRETAGKIKRIRNEGRMHRSEPERLTKVPLVGGMYLFYYDPKYKEELPYYDRYPLIFPYKKVPGGFYGLNLHYLPLQFRARLMDGLYDFANNSRYDESTKLRMNYQLLNATSKTRFFSPCVKHYLNDHVTSQFMYVYPSEWDIALFLPLERFQKKTKSQVWADTKRIIGGY